MWIPSIQKWILPRLQRINLPFQFPLVVDWRWQEDVKADIKQSSGVNRPKSRRAVGGWVGTLVGGGLTKTAFRVIAFLRNPVAVFYCRYTSCLHPSENAMWTRSEWDIRRFVKATKTTTLSSVFIYKGSPPEKKMFSFGNCIERGGGDPCPNFLTLFFHHVVPYILTSISCYVILFGHF